MLGLAVRNAAPHLGPHRRGMVRTDHEGPVLRETLELKAPRRRSVAPLDRLR